MFLQFLFCLVAEICLLPERFPANPLLTGIAYAAFDERHHPAADEAFLFLFRPHGLYCTRKNVFSQTFFSCLNAVP